MPLFHDHDRTSLRAVYFAAWRKHRLNLPLEPLEAQIADVIAAHPEYQPVLESEPEVADRDDAPEHGTTNPFLHLGLHLALRDQVATDRPAGIRGAFERIAARSASLHEAEHVLLECLGETLWDAERAGSPPDERRYLERVARLAGRQKPG
jgi:hypothetical protein